MLSKAHANCNMHTPLQPSPLQGGRTPQRVHLPASKLFSDFRDLSARQSTRCNRVCVKVIVYLPFMSCLLLLIVCNTFFKPSLYSYMFTMYNTAVIAIDRISPLLGSFHIINTIDARHSMLKAINFHFTVNPHILLVSIILYNACDE